MHGNETPETTDCAEHRSETLLGYVMVPGDMVRIVPLAETATETATDQNGKAAWGATTHKLLAG